MDWRGLSAVPCLGRVANQKRFISRCEAKFYVRPADPSRLSVERIQSEVGSIFCFRRANIRWARAGSSRLSCPDGDLRGDLRGHSHHRAYADWDACGTIAPLAAARTAPEYDPVNSGVGPRCCGRLVDLGN